MYKSIFVDQCGYLPEMTKRVTFRSDRPVTFHVVTSDGRIVYHGVAQNRVENEAAGEIDYTGDFSALTAPGLYRVISDHLSESDPFEIGGQVYRDVFRKAFAFFYLQRCGWELPESDAGAFAHRACHTAVASVYGTGEFLDVSGGWHDAGDYGRYVVPGAMAVAQLLYALEENPSLCSAYPAPAETAGEKGSLSPCLQEIKYELDWMLKLQRKDGQVYHKASCRHFCGFIMPDAEREDIVVSPVSSTATADFAAVAAMAARFFQKGAPEYAARLEQASRQAYEALRSMPFESYRNPPEITTGGYGDSHDEDERYWAAAELYKAFGDPGYREDFETLAQQIYHGYGWGMMGSYGNRAYLTSPYPTDPALRERIASSMVSLAQEILQTAEADGYGVSLLPGRYHWGSNMSVSNNGIHLLDAYRLTGRREFLTAAGDQLHYLLGRNPMGLCYLTGCGSDAVRHPHHRPSGFLGKAMPGMLAGGPCGHRADPTAKGVLPENVPPAKAFLDMSGSYSTNEVAIYWNSAFILLLSCVDGSFGGSLPAYSTNR